MQQQTRTDSSFSRTYLSATNNCFQQLHKPPKDEQALNEIRARNERLIHFHRVPSSRNHCLKLPELLLPDANHSDASRPAIDSISAKMAAVIEDDIYRPPESSDEEEQNIKPKPTDTSLPSPASTQNSRSKRPLGADNANARVSKRLKRDKQDNPTTGTAEKESQVPEFPEFLSQSSQRRSSQKYGKKGMYVPSPSPPTPQKKAQKSRIDVPTTPKGKSTSAESKQDSKMLLPEASPSNSPVKARLQLPDKSHDDAVDVEEVKSTSESREPASIELSSPKRRRGSSSSLSSVDSISSVQLDKTVKNRLNNEDDTLPNLSNTAVKLPPNHVQCLMCKRVIPREHLDLPEDIRDLSQLTVPAQQRICYTHRMQDAKSTWLEAGYPSISFESLPSSERVARHIKSLIPIVKRQQSSYYLDHLDNAISTSKGHQGKIKQYFDVTAISLINYGYYGPRGAKLLSRAITQDEVIVKVLGRTMRSDKTFKATGLARVIDCVLLPELLVKLVQEDMKLGAGNDAEENARKLLEESVDVGLMLCGDDDHVEEQEETQE